MKQGTISTQVALPEHYYWFTNTNQLDRYR